MIRNSAIRACVVDVQKRFFRSLCAIKRHFLMHRRRSDSVLEYNEIKESKWVGLRDKNMTNVITQEMEKIEAKVSEEWRKYVDGK